MRVSGRFTTNGPETEPLIYIEARGFEAVIIKHEGFGLGVFKIKLAVIRAVKGVVENCLGAIAVEIGAGEEKTIRS